MLAVFEVCYKGAHLTDTALVLARSIQEAKEAMLDTGIIRENDIVQIVRLGLVNFYSIMSTDKALVIPKKLIHEIRDISD